MRDVLGLCQFSWQTGQKVRCQALPQLDAIKQLPLLRSLTAEDGIPNPSGQPEGDRMEIRPYAPGDSVKNIMWKVYKKPTAQRKTARAQRLSEQRTLAFLLPVKTTKPQLLLQELRYKAALWAKTGLLVQMATKNQFQTMPSTVSYCRVERAETASCLWIGSLSRPGGQ